MSFSERMGIKKAKDVIQKDSIDDELRISLWNRLYTYYWDEIKKLEIQCNKYPGLPIRLSIDVFFKIIWDKHLILPLDTMPSSWHNTIDTLKHEFDRLKWNEVYDFIEFIINLPNPINKTQKFIDSCNNILKKDLSAYRIVGNKFVPITSEVEIAEVDKSLENTLNLKSINIQLKSALSHLSDKTNPDYRNSIKESINAVETLCRLIANAENATLGNALDTIENKGKVKFHGAFKEGLKNFYGYTSDSQDGIRHALMKEPKLDMEDSIFMLVLCSAFTNYLIEKSNKSGLKIK